MKKLSDMDSKEIMKEIEKKRLSLETMKLIKAYGKEMKSEGMSKGILSGMLDCM
jgi:hypothetical protein